MDSVYFFNILSEPVRFLVVLVRNVSVSEMCHLASPTLSYSFMYRNIPLLVQNADVSKLLYLESLLQDWRCEIALSIYICLMFSKGAVELQLSLLCYS
jgi:hypothetical protein